MNRLITPFCFLFLSAMLIFSASISAQDARPSNILEKDVHQPAAPVKPRPNLFKELGLNPEQLQAVRRMNQERKPLEAAARQRFQDATRALNSAIYTDSVDEAVFQAGLREFQAAQAELARIKFANELAVRKLLTPEQLVKFRDLRRRFAEAREEIQDERRRRPGGPLKRLRRGGPPPVN